MPVPKHLEEATRRLEDAEREISIVRELPLSLEGLARWLGALTSYAFALSEIHRFTNESIHEKLHHLAAWMRAPPFGQP